MAIKLHRPSEGVMYSLQRDEKSPQPTVFEIRELTREQFEHVAALNPMTMEQALAMEEIRGDTPVDKLSKEQSRKMVAVMAGTDATELLRRSTKQCAQACVYGLTNLTNLIDEASGKPLSVSVSEFVQYGDPEDVRELGKKIMGLSQMKPKSKKKSRSRHARG